DKKINELLDLKYKKKIHNTPLAMLILPILPISLVLIDSSRKAKTISSRNDQRKVLSKSSELIQIGSDDRYNFDSFNDLIELNKNKAVEQDLIQELRCCGDSRVFNDRKDIATSQYDSAEINESCATQISKTLISDAETHPMKKKSVKLAWPR
ncbi:485_t:CDS:2, partial [Acaulospora morrowiae]